MSPPPAAPLPWDTPGYELPVEDDPPWRFEPSPEGPPPAPGHPGLVEGVPITTVVTEHFTAGAVLDWFRFGDPVFGAVDGMGESPPNSNCNPLTRWFGLGCCAWCAITVSRAYNFANGDPDTWRLPDLPPTYSHGFAFVPYLAAAFARVGRLSYTFAPGRAAIWRGEAHVEVAETDLGDGTATYWGGNYGDLLARRRRTTAACFVGFGDPGFYVGDGFETPDRDLLNRWAAAA